MGKGESRDGRTRRRALAVALMLSLIAPAALRAEGTLSFTGGVFAWGDPIALGFSVSEAVTGLYHVRYQANGLDNAGYPQNSGFGYSYNSRNTRSGRTNFETEDVVWYGETGCGSAVCYAFHALQPARAFLDAVIGPYRGPDWQRIPFVLLRRWESRPGTLRLVGGPALGPGQPVIIEQSPFDPPAAAPPEPRSARRGPYRLELWERGRAYDTGVRVLPQVLDDVDVRPDRAMRWEPAVAHLAPGWYRARLSWQGRVIIDDIAFTVEMPDGNALSLAATDDPARPVVAIALPESLVTAPGLRDRLSLGIVRLLPDGSETPMRRTRWQPRQTIRNAQHTLTFRRPGDYRVRLVWQAGGAVPGRGNGSPSRRATSGASDLDGGLIPQLFILGEVALRIEGSATRPERETEARPEAIPPTMAPPSGVRPPLSDWTAPVVPPLLLPDGLRRGAREPAADRPTEESWHLAVAHPTASVLADVSFRIVGPAHRRTQVGFAITRGARFGPGCAPMQAALLAPDYTSGMVVPDRYIDAGDTLNLRAPPIPGRYRAWLFDRRSADAPHAFNVLAHTDFEVVWPDNRSHVSFGLPSETPVWSEPSFETVVAAPEAFTERLRVAWSRVVGVASERLPGGAETAPVRIRTDDPLWPIANAPTPLANPGFYFASLRSDRMVPAPTHTGRGRLALARADLFVRPPADSPLPEWAAFARGGDDTLPGPGDERRWNPSAEQCRDGRIALRADPFEVPVALSLGVPHDGSIVPLQGPLSYGQAFFVEGRFESAAQLAPQDVTLALGGTARVVRLRTVEGDPRLVRSPMLYLIWDVAAERAALIPAEAGSP